MRQFWVGLLVGMLLLNAVACGGDGGDTENYAVTTEGTTTTVSSVTATLFTTAATTAPASASVASSTATRKPDKTSKTTQVTTTTQEEQEDMFMTMYYEPYYLTPLWEGETVYHESVCFMENSHGEIVSGDLMYTPDEILSVRPADLIFPYEEGKDYKVEGKRLVLLPGSRIGVMPYDEYMPKYKAGEEQDWLVSKDDPSRHVGLTIDVIKRYQVSVSYTHSDKWSGAVPENQLSNLPRTKKALQQKKPLNIIFYGDSITAGWEASGVNEQVINMATLQEFTLGSSREPYMPSWAEMVCAGLRTKYGYNDIHKINRGAGGSATPWGMQNAATLVNPCDPDLVVLAFGMNQAGTAGDTFGEEIKQIMKTIRTAHPEVEFLLVSCMVANTDAASFHNNRLEEQEQALFALRDANGGVGVAPVNRMCRTLLDKGKLYTDLTGNNLNHPNDFAIRIYAQTVLAALGF